MLSVAEQYKGNNNFEYDLVDIVRQSNADKGNALLDEISQSYDRKDKENFRSRRSSSLNSFCRKIVYCLPGKNSPYLLG